MNGLLFAIACVAIIAYALIGDRRIWLRRRRPRRKPQVEQLVDDALTLAAVEEARRDLAELDMWMRGLK